MPISTKAILFAFFIALAIFLTPETGWCAGPGTKIVTRIDTVSAVMKGGTLTVHVEGMASTPSRLGRGGQLLKRGQGPNKDGLLEYELVFNPPQKNYTGDALKQVKTTLKVSSVPAGVKGVRIYAEYNELNGMLPEPKQGSVAKKKERRVEKEQFVLAKEKPAPENEEVAQKKEEPVVAKKEKPVAKREEAAPKKEEQTKTSQWWNPFHRKPAAPPVSTPPPAPRKQELASKKKEPVVKKEEPILTKKEKPTLKKEGLAPKKEEVATKKEETKKQGWNWNPFHHKPAALPVTAPPPAAKKETPVLKKKEPSVRKEESAVTKKENPISKKEEAVLLKKEEEAPKKEKKSRGWNLNPFHRKPAASQMDATPPEPKKEELAPKKKEPAVTKEKPAPKKQEATPPKKEETQKKSHWYWNPFHHKPDAQSSDESPR